MAGPAFGPLTPQGHPRVSSQAQSILWKHPGGSALWPHRLQVNRGAPRSSPRSGGRVAFEVVAQPALGSEWNGDDSIGAMLGQGADVESPGTRCDPRTWHPHEDSCPWLRLSFKIELEADFRTTLLMIGSLGDPPIGSRAHDRVAPRLMPEEQPMCCPCLCAATWPQPRPPAHAERTFDVALGGGPRPRMGARVVAWVCTCRGPARPPHLPRPLVWARRSRICRRGLG